MSAADRCDSTRCNYSVAEIEGIISSKRNIKKETVETNFYIVPKKEYSSFAQMFFWGNCGGDR